MLKKVLLCIASMCISVWVYAQKDNRNMMLNAESATVPREINIGLPESGNGAVVVVDGTKHAMGLPRSQYHWAGGNSYENIRPIDLMEAVVSVGEFGVMVDSHTRLGGEKLSGAFTGMTSTNGLIRVDAALRGPLGKGWFFAIGAYVNYDPTSVNAPSRLFVEQKQIYQAALSKRWENSSLDIMYRFSYCGDRIDGGYSVAPFQYNGDGSISLLNGFRMGRDCYMPADEKVRWMDLETGKWKEGDMSKLDYRYVHDATLRYNYFLESGWKLGANLHVCYMAPANYLKVHLGGVDKAEATSGYTLPDGSPFTGNVQNRLVLNYNSWTFDPELLLTAEGTAGKHKLKTGIATVLARQYESASSYRFAHTVESSPQRLYKDGVSTWNFNRNSTWFDGTKFHCAFYAFDDWRPLSRLLIRTGVRVKPLCNDVYGVPRLDNEDKNIRVEGFNLSSEAMYEKHHFKKWGIDYVVTEHVAVNIAEGLTAMVEGFYSMTNKTTTYYRNPTLPSLNPIGNALGRGGITYANAFMDLTAVVSYITSWNNAAPVNVTKQINGTSETLPWVAQYGIGTFGVTVDGNLHFGGFNLHARATWQDPKYKNYRNEFTFSDGSVTVIDYTGNTVTGISKLMLEFDPSYRWDFLKIWASVRYYSRQYVSRTNLAYFNGHFETFAGADLMLGGHHKVSLNFVNLLFQSGAKGSIDIADTIEDAAALEGLVMAGSYIRPFTVDLSYTYSF